MKAGIYFLVSMAAFALAACGGEKKHSGGADPVKLAEYKKHISRKWRVDTLFMEKELEAYRDTFSDIRKRGLKGSSERTTNDIVAGYLGNFREEIKYSRHEFFPDWKRLSTYYHFPKPIPEKYAFDSPLDTLYFMGEDGAIVNKYKIAAISDTALIVLRPLELPTKDPKKVPYYKARLKYVPVKE